ncbi:signal recognition particle protein [Desulfovibrio psychrotolerans]|uniref:Signal recognition particle protein n=1 Tax=Desulfovibrio psychrotolerans TaxID=415242 RepID=A0A7J0BUQ7_9BACT|nr:signal recognition particle protein [Desulfovibrio psychrotolerans]GFM36922.1 signal recognition particle protein [Desulfovibrio psychrotolerans]
MFETLSDRLNSVFKKFSGQKTLNEENVQEGLREVRLALLEADVNFKVVKQFTDRVRERCLGQEVLKGVNPAQQVIKIVHDELVDLLGGGTTGLDLRGKQPYVIMMVGLQGSGKTTSSAKLANYLRKQKMKPYLVPADVYRPAAIDQLHTLAKQLGIPAFASTTQMNPVDIATAAYADAREQQCNVVILDTAGRLHVDEQLMNELVAMKSALNPQEILFVADAMTGQDAVTVAEAFNAKLGLTGAVLTKMDGDARGGAALSIKTVTGTSVKFVGMGEKISDLEVFHPDRIAGRILGMGDVLTLVEKAQAEVTQEEAEAMAQKMQKAEFDFDDFRTQMRRMRKLGSLEGILKLIPGMGKLRDKLGDLHVPDKEMNRIESIINSMTDQERRNPDLINPSRKKRIAGGCGMQVQDVDNLIKSFAQMRMMMKQMMGGGKKGKKGKMPAMPNMPNIPGMSGKPGLPGASGMGGMGGMGGMSNLDALQAMQGMPGMGYPGMGADSAAPAMSKDDLKKKRDARKKEKMKKKQGRKKK